MALITSGKPAACAAEKRISSSMAMLKAATVRIMLSSHIFPTAMQIGVLFSQRLRGVGQRVAKPCTAFTVQIEK
jgi:hypothetical protein